MYSVYTDFLLNRREIPTVHLYLSKCTLMPDSSLFKVPFRQVLFYLFQFYHVTNNFSSLSKECYNNIKILEKPERTIKNWHI